MKKLTIINLLLLLLAVRASAWNTPSLVSPSDGANYWTETVFDWNAVNNTQFYQFQLDTVATFNSPNLFTNTTAYINSSGANSDTKADIINMRFGQTYYWRVRAWVANDTSAWTATRTLYTRDYVNITSPLSGTTNTRGVRLNWAPHYGVAKYEWQADTSINFNTGALKTGQLGYINSTDGNSDTQYDLYDTYFGKTYYWRVRAINNAPDTSAWSTPQDYTTQDSVTLTTNTGVNYWTGIRLDWTPYNGVSRYEFQADTVTTFNSPALKSGSNNYINSTDGNSDTQWDLQDIFFGKTYYWRVRAINAVDTTGWREVRNFTTRNYVTLSTPADGTVNRPTTGVTLDWVPHNGVAKYQVQMDSTSLFNSGALVSTSLNYINSTNGNSDTQYGSGALAANTVYFWRVRAINNAPDTCAWTQWAFSTGSTAIVYPNAPTLVAPANASAIAGTSTTLQWTAVTNATQYGYEYSTTSNFSSPVTATTTGTSATISGLLGSSTYYWRVKALNGSLPSPYSSIWSFTTPIGNITTNDLPDPTYCSGSSVTVSFTSTSTFTSSSTFTIQLSDASGSFSNPTSIGNATGANVTSVPGTLPANAATGSGYKVRIVSTLPSVTGSANPTAFSIVNTSSGPVISGTTGIACAGTTVTLSIPTVPGASYTWALPDGSNQMTPSITITNFSIADTGDYAAFMMVGSCIAGPTTQHISYNSNSGTTPVITANANAVCIGKQLSLSVPAQSGATYAWSGPNSFSNTQRNPSLTMTANGGGTYSVTVSAGGCDNVGTKSITTVSPTSRTIDSTVCFGSSVFGHSTSGTFRDTLVGSNTCDSIRILNLTVRPQITSSINQTICFGQSFEGHNATGTYTDHFTSYTGCDSARTLNLTVRSQNTSTVSQSICTGQSYAGHSTAGTYTDHYTDSHGCDSARTLNLTVVSQIATTVTQTICPGQTYAGHSTSGTYTDHYTASGGCDSVRTLNLTVRPANNTSISQTICFGQTYAGHNTSGTFTDHYTDVNGCDSARTLALTVLPQNGTTITQTICDGQSYMGHNASGTYTEAHTDSHGCDSNIVLNLTVLQSSVSVLTPTICQGQSFEGYTASGSYVDTFTGSNGCDSLRFITLTVNAGNTFSQQLDICSNDTLIINGTRVTTSGVYTETIPGANGECDTVATYTVSVTQAPAAPTISFDQSFPDVINAPLGYDSYSWFHNGVVIPNEFTASLVVTDTSGSYFVVVSVSGSNCVALSNTLTYGTHTGIAQLPADELKIYPNPSSGALNLEFSSADAHRHISISDVSGKTVREFDMPTAKQQVDISALSQGFYMLHVTGINTSSTYKILRQ